MSLSINLVIETSTEALLVTSSPRLMDAHGSIYHVLSLHDKLGTSGSIIKHNNVLAFDLQPTNHYTCSIDFLAHASGFAQPPFKNNDNNTESPWSPIPITKPQHT